MVHVACTEDANSECIDLFGESEKEFPNSEETGRFSQQRNFLR
jgi:hypothetical protein